MNAVQTFTFNVDSITHGIRLVEIDGAPWFVAADVCRVLALGYDKRTGKTNSGPVTARLSPDEKRTMKRTHSFALRNAGNEAHRDNQILSDLGGPKLYTATVISESGLYKLVMRSDKPEAKRFQDWVTRDVLPAIRKDGGYIAGQEKLASGELSDAEFLAR